MPVTRCPHCRTELDLDASDFGYRVQLRGFDENRPDAQRDGVAIPTLPA